MAFDDATTAWLLDSDPALRWQVERELGVNGWQATRERVATEGFGARLLALQDADGQWAGGAFFPAGFDFDNPGEGQPWTATTWSLKSLREWGVDASVLAGTAELLDANCRWEYDDLPYWGGEVDACINGFTLASGAWLGADVSPIAQWFVDHQMDEGGWNCEWVEGSTRASFVSTLNSIVGILEYEKLTAVQPAPVDHPAPAGRARRDLTAARHRAEEYLLSRRLLYRETTGEHVAWWVDKFAYPFRSFYNALTATDYFRAASLHDGTPPDPRLADAIELVRADRQPDGRWVQARRHPGDVWFEVDVAGGEPSKWLTFYAQRVLDWWDAR